jgi:hypothetical protein
MLVKHTTNADALFADKPRVSSEKRLAERLGRNLDIMPQGKRFLVMIPADGPEDRKAQNHVIFLQNFTAEVGRRVGTAK